MDRKLTEAEKQKLLENIIDIIKDHGVEGARFHFRETIKLLNERNAAPLRKPIEV